MGAWKLSAVQAMDSAQQSLPAPRLQGIHFFMLEARAQHCNGERGMPRFSVRTREQRRPSAKPGPLLGLQPQSEGG